MKTGLFFLNLILLVSLDGWMQASSVKLTEAYLFKRGGEWDADFLPEGDQLLVWSTTESEFSLVAWRNGTVRSFRLTGEKKGQTSEAEKRRPVSQVKFVPNTSFVFMTLDGDLFRVDRNGWRVVEAYGKAAASVAHDGSFVVIEKPEPHVEMAMATVVETRNWTAVRSIRIPHVRALITPDDKYLAVRQFTWRSDMKQCLMSFFEIESGRQTRVIDFKVNSGDCPGYVSFFHPTKPTILISEHFARRTVIFWDTETGKPLKAIKEPYQLQETAISPDGRWLFGSVRERDPKMLRDFKIWDVATGEVVYESPVYRNTAKNRSENTPVDGFFSPDGKVLAVRTKGQLRLYELSEK